MKEIYLDNSATTRVREDVAELMKKIMLEDYGNPSSMHTLGVNAEKYLREARETFASILKVKEKEIFFTSGGTESDNLAIIGCARANARAGKHLITTKIEHPAVLESFEQLKKEGFEVTYLGTDEKGCVRVSDLKEALREDTILVSVMHTNNEIGSVQPIEELGKTIKEYNPAILFHVDAVQGFGKAKIYPAKMNIDLLSASSHKIHGPKGVGILYIGEKVKIHPICYGGGQQKNMRSGTENVPGIAGMAKAAHGMMATFEEDRERMYSLKEYFIGELKNMEGIVINGPEVREGAPHIVSASIRGIRSEVILHALEEKGIYVSAGSACASNHPQISETLKAIGVEKDLLDSTIRFSMSVDTSKEQLEETVKVLQELLPFYRRFTRH